jgi:hypothetical protein
MEETGFLAGKRYILHDRDSKYCTSFCELIEAERIKALALPPRSPNLNAFAERWIRSVKEECLSKLILFGERSLKRALHHYETHYHLERNHQGKDDLLLFSGSNRPTQQRRKVRRRKRLGVCSNIMNLMRPESPPDEFFDQTGYGHPKMPGYQ